jgi:hypothetical protein
MVLVEVVHYKFLEVDLDSDFLFFSSFGDLMLLVIIEPKCDSLGTL